MSTVIYVILMVGVVLVAVNSWECVVKVLRFWSFGESGEDENERVLITLFRILSLDLVFSMSYVFFLSLFVDFPKNTAVSYFEKYNFVDYVGLMTILVVLEEASFRWVPLILGWLVKKGLKRDAYRQIGLVASLLFGLFHITNFPNPDPSYVFLVIPQIVGGLLYYWFVLKHRHGWILVVYAHVLFNIIQWL